MPKYFKSFNERVSRQEENAHSKRKTDNFHYENKKMEIEDMNKYIVHKENLEGHCYLTIFKEDIRNRLQEICPPFISFNELMFLLDKFSDYVLIFKGYKVEIKHENLFHIKASNDQDAFSYMELIRYLAYQNIMFPHFNNGKEIIIGAQNLDENRALLTSTIHRDVHETILLQRLNDEEDRIAKISPFKVPKHLTELLASRGIQTSSYQVELHDHPAHKLIESHLLFNVIKNYLKPHSTVAFMKLEKMNKLKNFLKKEVKNTIKLSNMIIQQKDLIRYPQIDYTQTIRVDSSMLFLHDSIMYNDFTDIYRLFKRNDMLTEIIATCIIPIETEKKHNSIFPELYQLEYLKGGKEIVYSPDRSGSSAYIQPIKAVNWLTTSIVHFPDLTFSIQKIESKFAHHILHITIAPVSISTYNTFDIPDLVKLPKLYKTEFKFRNNYLPTEFVNTMVHYAKTLKETDKKSLHAVIKTQKTAYNTDMLPHGTLEVLVDTLFLYVESGHSDTYRKLNLTRLKKNLSSYTLSLISNYTIAFIYRKLYRKLIHALNLERKTFTKRLTIKVINKFNKPSGTALTKYGLITKQRQPNWFQSLVLKCIPPNMNDQIHEYEELRKTMEVIDEPEVKETKIQRLVRKLSLKDERNVRAERNERFYEEREAHYKLKKNELLVEQTETLESLQENISCLETEDNTYEQSLEENVEINETNDELQSNPSELQSEISEETEINQEMDEILSSRSDDSNLTENEEEVIRANVKVDINDKPTKLSKEQRNIQQNIRAQEKLLKESNEVQEHARKFHKAHKCAGIVRMLCYDELCPIDLLISSSEEHSCNYDLPMGGNYKYPKNNDCLLVAVAKVTNRNKEEVWQALQKNIPRTYAKVISQGLIQLDFLCLQLIAKEMKLNVKIKIGAEHKHLFMENPTELLNDKYSKVWYHIKWQPGHWTGLYKKEARRSEQKVQEYLELLGLNENEKQRKLDLDDISDYLNISPAGAGRNTRTNKITDDQIKNFARNYKPQVIQKEKPPQPCRPNYANIKRFEKDIEISTGLKFRGMITAKSRAKIYVRALKAKTVGTLWLEHYDKIKSLDKMIDNLNPPKVNFMLIQGAAGSGKSTETSNVVASLMDGKTSNVDKVTIITPRELLRLQWIEKTSADKTFLFKTFETFLYEKVNDTVIIDELNLFPPGYLAAFLYRHANVKNVIAITDIAQNAYYDQNPLSTLKYYMREAEYYCNYTFQYKKYTHRLAPAVARIFGLKTSSTKKGEIRIIDKINPQLPVIVNSWKMFDTLSRMNYMTIMGSDVQGLDFESDYQILVDRSFRHIDFRGWYTMLTRGKQNVLIKLDNAVDNYYVEKILRKESLKEDYNNFLTLQLGNNVKYQDGTQGAGIKYQNMVKRFQAKRDSEIKEAQGIKMANDFTYLNKAQDLQLKFYLQGLPDAKIPDEMELEEFEIKEKLTLVHLPITNEEGKINKHKLNELAKETRELTSEKTKLQTDVIKEGKVSSLFQHQQMRDKVLKELTYKDRLTYTTVEEKEKKMREAALSATLLTESFKKTFLKGIDNIEWDQELFERSIIETEKTKLSKPLHLLLNQDERADIEWEDTFIQKFIKSQWVKKKEKINVTAKTGQVLACFNSRVLLTMAPLGRYIDSKLREIFSDNIFINSRKSQLDLDSFVKDKMKFKGNCMENDYTKFDQSQKAEFVLFQRDLLRIMNVPEVLISTFLKIKMECKTDEGVLDFMILTGEWCTYIFNTLDNMAFAALKYELDPEAVMGFSGDDSFFDYVPRESSYYQFIKHSFQLVSKEKEVKYPLFCGWILTPEGIIKDPELVFFRLKIAEEQNKLHESIESLYFDHLFAYKKGESLYSYLDLDLLEFHQLNCRYFAQHKGINRYYFSSMESLRKTIEGVVYKIMKGKFC